MRYFGLIGYPLSYSLSPVMHKAAFAAAGITADYDLWPTAPAQLEQRLQALRQQDNLAGCNITVPHKEAVLPLLDGLSSAARAIGAVNTVVKQDGCLYGYNTDAIGFVHSLRTAAVPLRTQKILVVGAGGAARAVCYGLLQAGAAQIYLLNRTSVRAQVLQSALSPDRITVLAGKESLLQVLPCITVVINATSSQIPWSAAGVAADVVWSGGKGWAVDLAYGKMLTEFLQAAAVAGWQTVSGEGMLLHQAAAAFELWTQRAAPLLAMQAALRTALVP